MLLRIHVIGNNFPTSTKAAGTSRPFNRRPTTRLPIDVGEGCPLVGGGSTCGKGREVPSEQL